MPPARPEEGACGRRSSPRRSTPSRAGGRLRGAGLAELAVKALHTPGGVHKFLLAGVERMAVGADFHLEGVLLQGGANDEFVPARAGGGNAPVRGVNVAFHWEMQMQGKSGWGVGKRGIIA